MYSSYVAGWFVLLAAPALGGGLVGWEALRPGSTMTPQRFENLLWLPAWGVAAGTVAAVFGWNWLWLGTMAVIVIGGYAQTTNHRAAARVIAIALIGSTLVLLVFVGVVTSIGCSLGGGCGWSLAELLAYLSGPMVLAGSTTLSAASIMKHRP